MRIDDLRTTLHDLADEAEDVTLPERLRGIDAHTRRDRRRRRMAGAAATVVALAAVGAAVTVVDPWRSDSSGPAGRPEPTPDPHAKARIQTITDQGFTFQVDPGIAQLNAHAVGTAQDGFLEYEVTPSSRAIAYEYRCIAPENSPYNRGGTDYVVEMTINGADAGSEQGCDGTGGMLTATNWFGPDGTGQFGIEPGEPATVRIRVVNDETGDVVTDPTVGLAGAFYDVVGEQSAVPGADVPSRVHVGKYNYRLVDYQVADPDRPLSLTVDTSDESVYYDAFWTGTWGNADGRVVEKRYRADGTLAAEETEASWGTSGLGDRTTAHDGDRIALSPSDDVTKGKLVIAVYEIDD